MRLIDNHWQVVSSEKGVEVTSARYHQWRPTKRRSIISRQSKSEIARPFPRATRAAIIGIKAGVNKFRIASNPISLSFAAFAESKAPEERDRSCTSSFVELVQNNSMLKRGKEYELFQRVIRHNESFVVRLEEKGQLPPTTYLSFLVVLFFLFRCKGARNVS